MRATIAFCEYFPSRTETNADASIDSKLNSDILTFMDPFGKLFEVYIHNFSIVFVALVHKMDLYINIYTVFP